MEIDAPNIGEIEKDVVLKALDAGFVSTYGPFVSEFERKIEKYINVAKAVSLQSGTAALHMALNECGIGSDDEVIVPVLTFVATVNPVLYLGAKPIFVDVDKDTWNIDPEEIKNAITKKTKAIMPVHLYGNPCNMDEIMKIALDHDLYVIEDATESLGGIYRGKHLGTFGNFGCLSFNGNKMITTGGGGMIVSFNEKQIDHIRYLVNQGRDNVIEYSHAEIGFNYRMTNLEASLGIAQMKRLDDFINLKKEFNAIYREELGKFEEISFQNEYEGGESSFWLTCIKLSEDIDVSEMMKQLKAENIPTRRLFPPLTKFFPYVKYKTSNFSNAYNVYDQGLCLPSSTCNVKDDVRFVCKKIIEIINKLNK